MEKISIVLVVEDELSEAIAETILLQSERPYHIVNRLGKSGFGYIKQNIEKFNQAAGNGLSLLIITDLDQQKCPFALINRWFGRKVIHPNLIFRVAVREIETWLMAHRKEFAKYVGVSPAKISADLESIPDPKAYLLQLAQRGKRSIKQELLPTKGSTARQGPGYNSCLSYFARNYWNVSQAVEYSDSLNRAWKRILQFTPSAKN